MPVDVIMPKLGLTMTAGVLVRWLAQDGKSVSSGQPIFEIETDKAAAESKAPASGLPRAVVQPILTRPSWGRTRVCGPLRNWHMRKGSTRVCLGYAKSPYRSAPLWQGIHPLVWLCLTTRRQCRRLTWS